MEIPAHGGRRVGPGLGLVVLTLCAYWPALGAGLIWDDVLFVGADRQLNVLGGFADIWTAARSPDYLPLTFSSLLLEERLFGFSAFPHHLINILLHTASALLLARILHRLEVPGAWLVAAIFAMHPVNVPSVAWIAERKNTLSLILYLASADFFLTFLADASRRRFYVLSLLTFLAALLSKTSVVALPLVLLWCAHHKAGALTRQDLLRVLPFFALAVALGLTGMHFQWERALTAVPTRTDSWASRVAIAGHAVWFYLGKIVLPVDLTLLYPRWATWRTWPPVAALLPTAALLTALVVLWNARGKWRRAPLLGLAFFLAHIFPVLGFFQMSYMANSLVADHWQYLPMIGVIAVAGSGGTMVARRWPMGVAAPAAAVLVIGALGALTYRRAQIFKDNETVWRDTVLRNPTAAVVHKNFAAGLRDKGMYEEAAAEFRITIGLSPLNENARQSLAQVLRQQGKNEDAVVALRDAVKVLPDSAPLHNDLAVALGTRMQFLDESILHARIAARLQPESSQHHVNLGVLLTRKGLLADAVKSYRRAMDLGTGDPNAPIDMARILSSSKFAQQDLGEAHRMAERANEMTRHGSAEGLAALAAVHAEAGDCSEAEAVARRSQAAPRGTDRPEIIEDMVQRLAACKAVKVAYEAGRTQPGGGQQRSPLEAFIPPYTSSRRCEPCHKPQYADWYMSHHRTMTQVPSPKTVLGDFSGKRLEFDGSVFRAGRSGGEFFVEVESVKKKVVLLTGSHHQQAYWYETGKGNQLVLFPLIYLIAEHRWVPDYAIFLKPPSHFVREEAGMWNHGCLLCHTTQGRPRDWNHLVDTQVAELGIACEACHGPGQAHAGNPGLANGARGILNPKTMPAGASAAVCGSCHGVQVPRSTEAVADWNRFGRGVGYAADGTAPLRIVRPRKDAQQKYLPELLERSPGILASHFWPDGTVRVTGREYNGLIDSPCFSGGKFSCLSCHDMHRRKDDRRPAAAWTDDQLNPGMDSDRACVQCHPKYDSAAALEKHTHHKPPSSGSRCINCHMPNTTYGLLKATRSHQVSSPRVAEGGDSQRPNACNLCHLDKPLRWAADNLDAWYRITPPAKLTADQESVASGVLWSLKGDAGIRALAAWSMGWKPAQDAAGTGWMPPYLANLLNDPYAAPRFIAHRSLRTLKGFWENFHDFTYDYVGPAGDRVAARERILKTWAARPGAVWNVAGVLLGSDGHLNSARFAELLRQRDDTPINLKE